MSKNRKNQSTAIRFGPALYALLLCLFIGGSAVGYVWQKDQLFVLGQKYKECEIALDKLRRRNEALSRVVSTMLSPAELEKQVRQMNLGLISPEPNQVVRISESYTDSTHPAAVRLYANGGAIRREFPSVEEIGTR